MTAIAVMGNISRDVVAGAEPRPGGGVFYAARALARLGAHANVEASCSAGDRPLLLPTLEAFGLPTTWHESSTTTAFRFHYEGDRRFMWLEAVGDPWTPEQAIAAAGDAVWIDVCALTRTDFPPETLAALATGGRRLLVDLQGLVRTAATGQLHTDEHIGNVLRHIEVLKMNEEEAETLVGSADPTGLRELGVPEIILTLGSQGAWVVTRNLTEWAPAVRVDGPVDPTGAGDSFSAAYLHARANGADPVMAAAAASELAAELVVAGAS